MKACVRILISVLLLADFVNAEPPTLILGNPKPGIYKQAEVSFVGVAIDKEDGKLNDALVWESNIDGLIGTGPKLSKVLSAGLHTITLSVKDSETYVSKAFTKIRIPGDESIKSGIEITSVPGFGSPGMVFGRVYGVDPKDYAIAGYIKVYGGWWNKPRWNRPVTKISNNNSFKLDITTVKTDKHATEIALFLVPKDYDPPVMVGDELPSFLFEDFPYATYERTYVAEIPDTTPPVITLLGQSGINVYVDETYIDLGATAFDDVDSEITGNILIVNPVDTAKAGTYIITYNVSDAAGNPAAEVTRTVIVSEKPDTTSPIITLLGENPVSMYVNDTYIDSGATAFDDVDSEITGNILIVNPVDTAKAGTYIITYNVSDAAGNPAAEVTRTVIVEKKLPPRETLSGVCYGPYRDNESPNYGIHPTIDEISEDIVFIPQVTKAIRTYGSTNNLEHVPALCEQAGIEVYPGAWIGEYLFENEKEISALIEIGKQGYSNVKVLVVGNEPLLRGDVSEQYIIDSMQYVREQTGLPVTVAETWQVLLNSPDVVNECDLILVHIHPYWDGVSVENAVDHVFEKISLLEQKYPGKTIVIGEVGMPSSGNVHGNAEPSPQNQAFFFSEFLVRVQEEAYEYFWFELFDEDFKIKFEGNVGPHWGLFNSDGSIKPLIANILPPEASVTINRPPRIIEPVEVSAPLLVYGDGDSENAFEPSGWMGNINTIDLDLFCEDNPKAGDTCIKFTYNYFVFGEEWAGLYWQYPLNNWGKYPGYNLSNATQLSFWVRGENGGEIAEFYAGGIEDGEYYDSFGPISVGRITLTTEWREYSFYLADVNTEMLIGGFAIKVLAGYDDNPFGAVIYLDEIVYESELGEPEIAFTYVPPIGSYDDLEGQVRGVNPKDYGVAVYIKVGSQWWQKPYWNRPVTSIKPGSIWVSSITTGGQDELATAIKAFLIPKDYSPPSDMSSIDPEMILAEVYAER